EIILKYYFQLSPCYLFFKKNRFTKCLRIQNSLSRGILILNLVLLLTACLFILFINYLTIVLYGQLPS
ncbi:hypothetical protein ACJX0J_034334, partial [Zea mays]